VALTWVQSEKALNQAVRDMVDRIFGGSSEGLVMSLIKDRQIDAEKIAKLSKKLDEELNNEGGDE
jgi:predicted transcriptional regulator